MSRRRKKTFGKPYNYNEAAPTHVKGAIGNPRSPKSQRKKIKPLALLK